MHSSTRISSPVRRPWRWRPELLGGVHLRHAERRSVGVGLHEERHAQLIDDCGGVDLLAAAQEEFAGEVDAVPGQRALGGDLVEGDDRRGHRARRVGNLHHVEVALQPAVLARRSVDDDQRIVECLALTVDRHREVVLVHLPLSSVGGRAVPVAVVQVDDRDVVFRVVERRFDLRGALESDLPLGGVAARQEGDFEFFHRSCGCVVAGMRRRSDPCAPGTPCGGPLRCAARAPSGVVNVFVAEVEDLLHHARILPGLGVPGVDRQHAVEVVECRPPGVEAVVQASALEVECRVFGL